MIGNLRQVAADFIGGKRLLVTRLSNVLIESQNGADLLINRIENLLSQIRLLLRGFRLLLCLLHGRADIASALLQAGDDLFDFIGAALCAGRERAYFIGPHRKATSLFTGAGGFNRGIERQ